MWGRRKKVCEAQRALFYNYSKLSCCRFDFITKPREVSFFPILSLFQVLCQCGWLKKQAGDERGSGSCLSPALFFDRPHWPRAWNRLLRQSEISITSKLPTMSSRVVCKKFDIFYASLYQGLWRSGVRNYVFDKTSWDILELGTVQEQDISSH